MSINIALRFSFKQKTWRSSREKIVSWNYTYSFKQNNVFIAIW